MSGKAGGIPQILPSATKRPSQYSFLSNSYFSDTGFTDNFPFFLFRENTAQIIKITDEVITIVAPLGILKR